MLLLLGVPQGSVMVALRFVPQTLCFFNVFFFVVNL